MKALNAMRIAPPKQIPRRLALLAVGAAMFALNLNTFVKAANLIPGGVTGVTVLIQNTVGRFTGVELPFSPLYYIANAIPVYIGFRYIGFWFTLFSCFNVVLTGILTDIIPTIFLSWLGLSDPLLCAVFGGVLNGAAVSVCLFADATSGGTDFIAIYFSEKRGKDCWNLIFAANCVMLVFAGVLGTPQSALYSIIFQWTTTVVTGAFYKVYQQRTLLVITSEPEKVYEFIRTQTHHDATSFSGIGLYKKQERILLYSVVSAGEVLGLIAGIRKIDARAFVNVLKTESIAGEFYKRPKD